MDRRNFLKALLCSPVFLKLSGLAAHAEWAVTPPARRFIDVHCHFFNAADLPIRGFLERVALADYNTSQAAIAGSPVWRGMAALLADSILKRQAPPPSEEMACLDTLSCGGTAIATRSVRAGGPNADSIASLSQIIEENYAVEVQTRALAAPARKEQRQDDIDDFTAFVLQEMQSSGQIGPEVSTRSLLPGPAARGTAQSIAHFLFGGGSAFSRYYKWAEVLVDYRSNIANTYRSLYDPGKSRLILATPALVDYSYWLDDHTPSPVADQIKLTGLLSLRSAFPIHGFAPFDPLRAVERKPSDPSPLELVQDAVKNHGFLGAKLYSPMGFRPTRNGDLPFAFPVPRTDPKHTIGQLLDQELEGLYAWCEKEDAAILAHTTDSQSAGPQYAERAEPKLWQAVLDKHPTLRLNLAHFGNFSQAFCPGCGADPAANFGNTWEREIGNLIKSGKFPNVYADISYFWWVLDGKNSKNIDAVKTMLKRYFHDYDQNVEHLMFGTDWNMTAKSVHFESYVNDVESFFKDIGLTDAQLDNLFYKNAVRFLGLRGSTKTVARLKKFYRDGGKPYPEFV
jgi:predicted TIM-barrel fold metal-dependent hydrolase